MNKHLEQKHDWAVGIRRHRTLARTLHGRLLATADGRLWIIRGTPTAHRLLPKLTNLPRIPPPGEGLAPELLGLDCSSDGELTATLLASFQQSLLFWERALRQAEETGPRDRRSGERRAQERREVERLQRRLLGCYRLLREFQTTERRAGLPYVLDADEERELAQLLRASQSPYALPEFERWLARLVMWLSGPRAAARFLAAVTSVIDAPQLLAKTAALERLRDYLQALKRRSGTEYAGWLHVELAERLNQLPSGLISTPGEKLKRRGTFPELCDKLLARCERLLAGDLQLAQHYSPAAIATLAACDGGLAPLPAQLFQMQANRRSPQQINKLAIILNHQSRLPGYERLLTFLSKGSDAVIERQLFNIRRLLARGTREDDIRWLAQEEVWLNFFDESNASVPWLRRTHALFERRHMNAGSALYSVLARCDDANKLSLQQWIAWLERLTPATVTPRIGQLLHSALKELVNPAFDLGLHDELKAWTRAAAVPQSDDPTAAWLQRIQHLQQLGGQAVKVPKSVRKLLDQRAQAEQELAHLHSLAAQQAATPGQLIRYYHLQTMLPQWTTSDTRVARAAEEAFVILAVETLRSLVHRAVESIWNEHSCWQRSDVPFSRLMTFAQWLRKMPSESRALHTELMAAWRDHGSDYRRHLQLNQDWLARAAAQGIDLTRWLHGESQSLEIDGRPVEICLAADPREIFLMGSYFHTCLSLGDCNQMSVLANACDANKQVVYAYGQKNGKRVALARMLITVSNNFQLLRYGAYTAGDVDAALHEKVVDAIVVYAARHAQTAGLVLADCGEPASLGKHFWYDDGEAAWPASAKQAWQSAAVQPSPASQPATCSAALSDEARLRPFLSEQIFSQIFIVSPGQSLASLVGV
ncbi:hypothetical protein ETAA8_69320 [Anatilimnocola aggregata]|uniref:Uncharacterized protein n=1 Tax=Anatilimnocola aggregata TaxID=2528021 RepID=A0A517YNH2_9BACT|nr:hypothetical protein [Anatilimnocola aggregata]QDU31772.1 hypothetical protein ETAA8_69320 [Anatilimnocola aggregata]